MKDNREKEPEIKVKSVKKALDVLNCFIKKQPLGVTEISEMLGLYKSNVYDILTTLTAMEYLTQVKETGKYELGIGIARLGNAVGDRFGFHKLAGRHIHEIAAEVGGDRLSDDPDGHLRALPGCCRAVERAQPGHRQLRSQQYGAAPLHKLRQGHAGLHAGQLCKGVFVHAHGEVYRVYHHRSGGAE